MSNSKLRGGKKAHRKRVEARNKTIKAKQQSFIKQFKERLDAGVKAELQKQADEVRETSGTTNV